VTFDAPQTSSDGGVLFVTVGDSRRFDLASVRSDLEAREAAAPTASPRPAPEVASSGVRLLSRRTR
jgi:glucose/arabinose dehydrogenase